MKRFPPIFPLGAVLLAVLLLLSCGHGSGATATAPGRPATRPAGPRIVSTVPAATMNLLLIGALDRVVGVSKYDQLFLPEEQRNLPVVGDYESMNFEQLVALRPTALIIQQTESRISPRLREVAERHGIELVNMRFDRVEDIWASVRALGRVAGRENEAQEAITRAQQELRELQILYGGPEARRPKVVYVASPRLMLIAGKNTFIEEMITLAGGANAAAPAGNGFLEVGREAIVKLAPEVLLVDISEEPGEQANDPRLQPWITLPVPAARSKRVYLVDDGNALMASVAIGRNVRMLAELIHAGAPADAPATGQAAPRRDIGGGGEEGVGRGARGGGEVP